MILTIAGGIILAWLAIVLWPVTLGVIAGWLTWWATAFALSALGASPLQFVVGTFGAAIAVGIVVPVKIYGLDKV